MPETIISIDDRALAPWCEVADVLGLSLPQFLEWLIGYIGSYRNERAMVLDETATQNVYPTQEQAAAVAERLVPEGGGFICSGRRSYP
jgi:hypothetical protein